MHVFFKNATLTQILIEFQTCLNLWPWSSITVFKNKLLTKVDAPKNQLAHENRCIKRPGHSLGKKRS